ncbi:MAG: RsbRD N-terminal domain-containing protein [Proteobacteria bacterium]|nr:RsbRD N-terminal domain-containing protein [Pseudomonadota bacterium]
MSTESAILGRWLAVALTVYGEGVAALALHEADPFRNPVGVSLRTELGVLVRELLGGMDQVAIDAACTELMAVRAVQDLSVPQALDFIFELRAIVRAELPGVAPEPMDARIDRLAMAGFVAYLRRREQMSELRLNERLRGLGPLPYRLRNTATPALVPGRG